MAAGTTVPPTAVHAAWEERGEERRGGIASGRKVGGEGRGRRGGGEGEERGRRGVEG